MPYIEQSGRTKIDPCINALNRQVDGKGELTYALTMLVLGYVDKHGKSYDSYSDVLGCLTAVQHELYRVEVSKYEDAKRVENGPLPDTCGCVRLADCEGLSAGCRLTLAEAGQSTSRRCPCGGGVDRCETELCIGSEGTTDGGW